MSKQRIEIHASHKNKLFWEYFQYDFVDYEEYQYK